MKKITPIIIVIILILVVWFTWNKMDKKEVIEETPEQILDKSTQADTTDEIEVKLDNIDVNGSSTEDFGGVDAEIKSI